MFLAVLRYAGVMLAAPETGDTFEVMGSLCIEQAISTRLPNIDEWRDLARNASEPNPFFEHWFLKPALEHLVEYGVIRLALYRVGDQLCGLFPLSVRGSYGRSPVRNVGNWVHYQCFLGTPLIRTGHEQGFWRALITQLDAADWPGQLMSFSGLDPSGPVHAALLSAAAELGRASPTVHTSERAQLQSALGAEEYLQAHVRSKKRKEWRRLDNRLAEMGAVTFSTLDDASHLRSWCDAFLALESAGWKGERGAALANTEGTQSFFLQIIGGAFDEGLLDFQRLDLDGRPIAMLVNFVTPPGSWSFKIAYDEQLARFSPGVMIELRNLERVLGSSEIEWMDSCAVENHPMIDSIWAERREIVQVSIPLSGIRRRTVYAACRAAETGSSTIKRILNR